MWSCECPPPARMLDAGCWICHGVASGEAGYPARPGGQLQIQGSHPPVLAPCRSGLVLERALSPTRFPRVPEWAGASRSVRPAWFRRALSPTRSPRVPEWTGASRSVRQEWLRRAHSPMCSPRVPPLTMLGLDGPHSFGDGAPNIVKNGTPQIGRALKPFLTVGRLGVLGARGPIASAIRSALLFSCNPRSGLLTQ